MKMTQDTEQDETVMHKLSAESERTGITRPPPRPLHPCVPGAPVLPRPEQSRGELSAPPGDAPRGDGSAFPLGTRDVLRHQFAAPRTCCGEEGGTETAAVRFPATRQLLCYCNTSKLFFLGFI